MITKLDSDQIQVQVKVDKANYTAGDLIKGLIYIKVKSSDLDCSMLFLKLIGVQKANQYDKRNQCFRFKDIFYSKNKWLCNFGSHLKEGIYKREFEVESPQDIPSFCVNYYKTVQCRLMYILSLYFTDESQSTLYKLDQSHKIAVHVHHIPTNMQMPSICYVGQQRELKKLCFLNGGSSSISLQINKQEFVIGEEIEIALEVDNTKTDLNLLKINFSVQSQLIILYPLLKLKISNYFGLAQSEYNIFIKGRSKQQLQFKLKLEQNKNDSKSIYPQSSIISDRIIHHYNFCMIANYSQNFYNCNRLTIAIPICIYQWELRNQQLYNGTNSKQKAMFSDHKINGYGPQDGCSDKSQIYNAEDSFEDDEFQEENTSPSNNFNRQDPISDYEELENEFETICVTQQQQINKGNQQETYSKIEIEGFNIKKVIVQNEDLDIIQEENDDKINHSVKKSNDIGNSVMEPKIDQKIINDTIFK